MAFLHADDNDPGTKPHALVTAAVDRIDCRRPLSADVDYLLTGNVTWTGKSSMRVSLSVGEKPALELGADSASTTRPQSDPCLTGSFLFVAVGPDGRGVQVNPLQPETEAEQALFEQGEHDKQRRLEEREASLERRRPSDEESDVLHSLLGGRWSQGTTGAWGSPADQVPSQHQPPNASSSSSSSSASSTEQPPPAGCADLRSTRLSNTVLMQPQQRNTAGRVFGGYLMR